jgi:hypothetical protein
MSHEIAQAIPHQPVPDDIVDPLSRDGYVFVAAPQMRVLLQKAGLQDWETFSRSWNDLGTDTYMADGGRYRRRRYAAFSMSANGIIRRPHEPHYQSRDYNPLNGGIERWFEPMTEAVTAHPALTAILHTCHTLFDQLTAAAIRPSRWHVEVHQFRIEAKLGQEGHPTPEGLHRDGVDWVMVLLVARENLQEGATTIYDRAKRPLSRFTLAAPYDTVFMNDRCVFHGVTPVAALDPSALGYRDALAVTFRGNDAGVSEANSV